MKQQVKTDWIINNQNIFGLQQDINLSISSIQYEILNQVKGKNINSISDYLDAEIDISKEIRLTKKLTIEKVFAEFLGFENINPLEQNNFNCSLILGYLQLSLFKEYSENKHKNILTISEYKTQYNSLLNNFLASNIDTDEQDFIKAELTLCNNLLTEMNKPVYSVLSPLNEVLDKPCEYKKNLTNSIDKRKKFLEQKANEKYPKIKALFHFIEYLHSNIENFNQHNGLIKELEQLDKERNQLKPQNNYKDKRQYYKVQAELESKFKTLQDNTANLIKAKARELYVCNFDSESNYNFNGVETEIRQLKDNFSNEDLPEIFRHKSQYIEYRGNTHGTFLSLQFFFDELDEITKSLFDYFKDTEQNEFEAFEIKAIPVNSIAEVIQGFKKGQTKFTLPTSFLFNTSTSETLPPQQTEKPKPELNEALISFSSTEIIDSLHSELKGYFQGKEAELKKALQGEQLKEFLLFPHNQNKFVEVFKRLKYNGFLLSTPKETKDWICSTFTYQYQKGNKKEVREFNTSTVHDILTKDKGEPTKKERICIVEWLPYKSHLTRQREAEKESI